MRNYAAPKELRGFEEHGVSFKQTAGTGQVVGDCPFCGKDGHFYVSVTTKAWDCKRCGAKGSFYQFLELISLRNQENMKDEPLAALSKHRGIRKKTLLRWGVGWDGFQYTLPVTLGRRVIDLRRYELGGRWMSTSGCKVGLINADHLTLKSRSGEPVWICEGEWDAMVWHQVLLNKSEPGTVLAMPGAGVFRDEWGG